MFSTNLFVDVVREQVLGVAVRVQERVHGGVEGQAQGGLGPDLRDVVPYGPVEDVLPRITKQGIADLIVVTWSPARKMGSGLDSLRRPSHWLRLPLWKITFYS